MKWRSYGPMAAATLHYWWELYQKDGDTSTVSARCRNLWDEYLAFTEKMEMPLSTRYQQIHLGHCAFLPAEERRFITEDLIRATGGLVGTPEEIIVPNNVMASAVLIRSVPGAPSPKQETDDGSRARHPPDAVPSSSAAAGTNCRAMGSRGSAGSMSSATSAVSASA